MTEHLPACLTPDRADELAFNDEGRAYTIEAYGTDRNGYINGDVPTKGVLNVGHGCVYITGTVGEGARLRGRQGVYCARSISASTILDGGNLLIVSNDTRRKCGANFTKCSKFDAYFSSSRVCKGKSL